MNRVFESRWKLNNGELSTQVAFWKSFYCTLSLAAFRNSFVMALATFRKIGEITVLSVFIYLQTNFFTTYKQIFSQLTNKFFHNLQTNFFVARNRKERKTKAVPWNIIIIDPETKYNIWRD